MVAAIGATKIPSLLGRDRLVFKVRNLDAYAFRSMARLMEGKEAANERVGTPGEVFRAFLYLGMTSFGGPVAHLGYFRTELIVRRRWIDEAGYADLLALCQFLPGPASSQVGFALGLRRAGALGALAAWAAFTLPSAILMFAFAYGAGSLGGPIGQAVLHGLKLVAVSIVAHAVWGMARTLTPDARRIGIALVAAAVIWFIGGAVGQIGAIVIGAAVGLLLCRASEKAPAKHSGFGVSARAAIVSLLLFVALLGSLPLLASLSEGRVVALSEGFYRAGALVFGGGHVVLPLLQEAVVEPGWVTEGAFLAGYGAAQAIPGPLFALSAYLGALSSPGPGALLGAGIAMVALFLPGFLLVIGALPFWDSLRRTPRAQAALAGTNAAVVGLLGVALYDPVWTGGVTGPADVVIAVAGFIALAAFGAKPLLVVFGIVAASIGSSLL